jgi:hypothetical protein
VRIRFIMLNWLGGAKSLFLLREVVDILWITWGGAYIIYYVKLGSRGLQPDLSFLLFWQIRG